MATPYHAPMLLIQEVIDASLRHPGGMMLSLDDDDGDDDGDDAGLTQLFIVLEHLLCHGLRHDRRKCANLEIYLRRYSHDTICEWPVMWAAFPGAANRPDRG
jgi:hypothetical protein